MVIGSIVSSKHKQSTFVKGNTDIGYGLRPEDPREQNAENAGKAGGSEPIDFDAYSSVFLIKRAALARIVTSATQFRALHTADVSSLH